MNTIEDEGRGVTYTTNDLRGLADCDARSGEPLGKALRWAAEEIDRLRSALAKLDSYMDFSEPQPPCGCWPDPSGFNEAMAEAKAALDGANG